MNVGGLVLSHIKQEPQDETDCNVIPSKKSRQVLVNYGLSRKKVFRLDGVTTLAHQFEAHAKLDPAFSKLMKNSYLVFQEYSVKFGTWVDIDCEESLSDGTVVKAVFFPKKIEADSANPGSVMRKRKRECDTVVDTKRSRVCSENLEDISFSFPASVIKRETENALQGKSFTNEFPQTQQSNKLDQESRSIINSQSTTNICCEPKELRKENYISTLTALQIGASVANWHTQPKEKDGNTKARKKKIRKKKVRSDLQNIHAESNINTKIKSPIQKIINFSEWHKRYKIVNDTVKGRRLEWGRQIVRKTINKGWTKFIFSGITGFCLENNYIKRTPHSHPKKVGTDQNFWGSVTDEGTVIISTISHTFNGEELHKILKENVLPFVDTHFKRGVKLQCFNMNQYTFKKNCELYRENCIKLEMWPIYVREMSPLEHVWELIAEKVKNKHCSSVNSMISSIYEVWAADEDLPLMCKKFVSSMECVILDMVKKKGGIPDKTITW